MTISTLLRFAMILLLPIFRLSAADRVAEASSGKAPDLGDMVLFPLDDYSIPWRDNLKLTLQAPEKYTGNPVLKAGPIEGPDGYGCCLYGTVIKQGSKYCMWYQATPLPDSRIPGDVQRMNKFYRPLAYTESTDGIHWIRPNLGLVDFRGNKNNNLLSVEPASNPYSRIFACTAVIYDPSDQDLSRRYKMAYIFHDIPLVASTTATAVSPDGLRWTVVNTTSFTKGHFENFSLVRFHGLYYLSGQNIPSYDGSLADGSPAGRVMKIFFSPDFHHWSSGRAFGFYRSDYVPKPTNTGQETHEGAGLWNRGNVLLGFYGRWLGDTLIAPQRRPKVDLRGLKIDLGLIISNDGIHFREPVRNFVMVRHGPSDAWDSEALIQANAFANSDTETLIWYGSWDTSMPNDFQPLPAQPSDRIMQKAFGVGLVTLPRDRFGYFSKLLAVAQEKRPEYSAKRDASCLTRSLTLHERAQLFVNVDNVSPNAALSIELVDDAEQPLAGYTGQLSANSLKAPVAWLGRQPSLPVNMPFRIKVTWPIDVNEAKLYALYIEHR